MKLCRQAGENMYLRREVCKFYEGFEEYMRPEQNVRFQRQFHSIIKKRTRRFYLALNIALILTLLIGIYTK